MSVMIMLVVFVPICVYRHQIESKEGLHHSCHRLAVLDINLSLTDDGL